MALQSLVREIHAGRVDTLIITAWNPVYSAPVDLDFGEALSRVPTTFYLGTHEDETAARAVWFAPAAHFLESWGDARALDGTISLVQPLIAPLFHGMTSAELLSALSPSPLPTTHNDALSRQSGAFRNPFSPTPPATPEMGPTQAYQQSTPPQSTARADSAPGIDYVLLRQYWIRQWRDARGAAVSIQEGDPGDQGEDVATQESSLTAASLFEAAEFERFWEQALQRGYLTDSAAPLVAAQLAWESLGPALAAAVVTAAGPRGLEISFHLDARVYDGRWANNPWLQELPDPLTKLTWDNAALVSPATARRLQVDRGDYVNLQLGGRTLRAAILPQPGHADECVSLTLGYGRGGGESQARGAGFNASLLRTTNAFWFNDGLAVRRATGAHLLALEQEQSWMEARSVALQATLGQLRADPKLTETFKEPLDSLWPQVTTTGHKWGMAIDLSRCVGCGACVTACRSENNVPTVGKEQVARGRIMIWLRVDRYWLPDEQHADDAAAITQPLFCVHCEDAPCEYVCPVNATVHSDEGLNEMVYNRCIGTRYCSNNCPYKVRRFNFLSYDQPSELTSLVRMGKNPDVTIRSRGVMEKCTYCVQRIERARIDARTAGHEIRQGDVVTACQQTCPAQAIVFGDLNDPTDPVASLHRDERSYKLLHQLGTRPRTAHMLRVKNPNPELKG